MGKPIQGKLEVIRGLQKIKEVQVTQPSVWNLTLCSNNIFKNKRIQWTASFARRWHFETNEDPCIKLRWYGGWADSLSVPCSKEHYCNGWPNGKRNGWWTGPQDDCWFQMLQWLAAAVQRQTAVSERRRCFSRGWFNTAVARTADTHQSLCSVLQMTFWIWIKQHLVTCNWRGLWHERDRSTMEGKSIKTEWQSCVLMLMAVKTFIQ